MVERQNKGDAADAARAGGPSGLSQSSLSQPEALIAIAKECEAAPARDQHDLLREAFKAVFGGPECIPISHWPGYKSPRWDRFHSMLNAGAHLDAAMTLVDRRALWAIGSMEDGPFCRLCWPQPDGGFAGGYFEGQAETVPLSICSAALKALAAAARQGGDVKQAPGEAPQSGGDSRNAQGEQHD